jgi:carbonic anhydrase
VNLLEEFGVKAGVIITLGKSKCGGVTLAKKDLLPTTDFGK